jgi:hypothetical protein
MAMRAKKLPLDDAALGLKYIGGIARHAAIDDAGVRAGEKATEALHDREGVTAAPREVPPETRDLAAAVHEEGKRLFGASYLWYVRNRVQGHSMEEIAEEAKVSPGYVRNRVAIVQRELAGLLRASGLGLFVLLAFFVARTWERDLTFAPARDVSARVDTHHVLDLQGLRQRARDMCAASAWEACLDDLDAAKQLAPVEPEEMLELRAQATRMIDRTDEADPTFNAKPRQ